MSQDQNIQALLDGTLDDVADLPEFIIPNAGTYLAEVKFFGAKKVNDKTGIEFAAVFKELLEPADANDEPQQLPIEANTMFFLFNEDGTPNELGQGQWKELLKVCKEITGAEKNTEIMEQSKGIELILTTGVRVHKDDKKKPVDQQRRYLQIKQAHNPAA